MIRLNFSTNLDSIASLAGAMAGIETALNDPDYLDAIAKEAHDETTVEFDIAAASAAGAGYMSHVYEFGVPGITHGPARVSDPLSEQARLWQHRMVPVGGGSYEIEYNFRPAVIPNPQPTTERTGVPSKVLRKLSRRKYVFWNKAAVVEYGMEVERKSKQEHGLVFIPFNHKGDGDRTYMMWHVPSRETRHTTPGMRMTGQFTNFWESWWNGTGEWLMHEKVGAMVELDIREALRAAEAAAREPIEPAQTQDFTTNNRKGFNATQSVMVKKTGNRKRKRSRR